VNGLNIAASNIPVGVLVAGQASAKMAEFVVNGNGTVTSIELMRTGVSNNATLKNVYLYDGANSHHRCGVSTQRWNNPLHKLNGSIQCIRLKDTHSTC
jgi:hypothetical protein